MNRQNIKLMINRLIAVDCDITDRYIINDAITMLEQLGDEVAKINNQENATIKHPEELKPVVWIDWDYTGDDEETTFPFITNKGSGIPIYDLRGLK